MAALRCTVVLHCCLRRPRPIQLKNRSQRYRNMRPLFAFPTLRIGKLKWPDGNHTFKLLEPISVCLEVKGVRSFWQHNQTGGTSRRTGPTARRSVYTTLHRSEEHTSELQSLMRIS